MSLLELAVVCALGLLVVAPFLCWRRRAAEEHVIRLWAYGRPDERPLFLEAVALFETQNPGVNVKFEEPSSSRMDKFLAAMQAGSCGDVLYLHWTTLATFASKNTLVPLDELCERDGADLEDFLAAAKTLTVVNEQGRMTQVGCLPYDPSSWAWSAGGAFANDACTETYFTRPETLAGLDFYAGLRNRWQVSTRNMNVGGHDPAAVDVFEKGHVAMAVSGPWMLSKYVPIDSFRWDIALFPKGPAGRHTRYAGMGFAVWAGSHNKKLAWNLTKFLCGKEAQAIFSKGFLDIPARRSIAYGVFARCSFAGQKDNV